MPRSSTSSTCPAAAGCVDTVTMVSGGENEVAFSSSSASRWMTSLAAWPLTPMPSIRCAAILG
jgi:hypothetical protein